MWSVLLLPAAAVLSDVVANMERVGAHEAARKLEKALAHDDPLAHKLKAFADAISREVEAGAATTAGAASWMEHDAGLAQLTGFAEMRDAARKAGLLSTPAGPSSFSQTGSKAVYVSPFDATPDLNADFDPQLRPPTFTDMARLEDQDTAESAFEQSLDPTASSFTGVTADVQPPDILGVPEYDYNGDVTPSLDSLTSQLVTDAAESDAETHEEFPSSLAQVSEPDNTGAEEEEEADNAEIEKVAKQAVLPIAEKIKDPKVLAMAAKLGVPVPTIEVVKMPISDAFMRRKAGADQRLEQDHEEEAEALAPYRSQHSRDEDVLFERNQKDEMRSEAAKHKRSLAERVKADQETLLKDLDGTDQANNADLKGHSLQDAISEAYGGGPVSLEKDERELNQASSDQDDDSSFVQVLADGHMRTGK